MTDQQETSSVQAPEPNEVSTNLPTIIYVLYLTSLVVGITSIVGVVLAYINKGEDNYLDSHYQFQIRTFWIGLLYTLIGFVLIPIFIGWLILLFVVIWIIIRCAKGLKFLGKKQPLPDATSWMFG